MTIDSVWEKETSEFEILRDETSSSLAASKANNAESVRIKGTVDFKCHSYIPVDRPNVSELPGRGV